jgi:nitrate reductase NapE component
MSVALQYVNGMQISPCSDMIITPEGWRVVQTFLVPVMGIYDVLAISFVATYIDEGGA